MRNSDSVVAVLKEKKEYIWRLDIAHSNFENFIAEDFITKTAAVNVNALADDGDFLMPLLPTRAIEAGEYEFVNNAEKGKRRVILDEEECTFQAVPSELIRKGKKQFNTDFPDHIVLDVNYLRERLRLMKSRGETPWDPYMQSVFDKYLAAVGK